MQTAPRLIDQFIPSHYQLTLDINRAERRFTGTVSINGASPLSGGQIILHSKDLDIQSATLDGKEAAATYGNNDELIITHPDIHEGRHIVVIAFSGTITDAMHGLYPCYYEHEGIKKELLATQFESHHAREVFPCIDEPEAKATFDVILGTEQNISVLGNMPIKQQRVEDEKLVTTFETTPRMSTYLVAWVAGELQRKTAVTKSGVEVNIWATHAQPSASLDFALEFATKSIDYLNDYFDEPYPLPKSDHVALPDFSNGAMENWGLITYREIMLLADPATTGISAKQLVAGVIAHELSHQWFGNLVTMKWWDNIWLNESFARFMENYIPDVFYPEWDSWLDFASNETITALERDSLEGIQPVQTEVNHPDEINSIFDPAIVYSKGGRLLRMLEEYIGPDNFQAGLAAYFNKYKYSNTIGDNLWDAFAETNGQDIASFMNTWISQSGYPVLHVSQTGDQLTLSQEQFFTSPHEPNDKLWPIPLGASDPDLPTLMTERSIIVPRSSDDTLRFNIGDTAHFITHYDEELLADLIHALRRGELAPLDRLQLLHEQSLLARGGIIPSANLIPLLTAYRQESVESVWGIVSHTIISLKKFVETDMASENALRALSGKLAREQYERLGWMQKEGDTESDAKLRSLILGLMVYSKDEATIKQAIDTYQTTPLDKLDPELRVLILSTVVRFGNEPSIHDTLLQAYMTSSSAALRKDIAGALCSTSNKAHIAQLLDIIINGNVVRHQDVIHWCIWLLRNQDGRELTWKWIRDNWAWIEKTFGSDKSYDAFPKYSANLLTTREQFNEYREFFTPLLSETSLARIIAVGLIEIEGRVELIERDRDAVRDALADL